MDFSHFHHDALCLFIERAIARGDLHPNLTYAEIIDLDNALALDHLQNQISENCPISLIRPIRPISSEMPHV